MKRRKEKRDRIIAGAVTTAAISVACVCAGVYFWKRKNAALYVSAAKKAVDPVVKLAGTVAIPFAVKDGVAAFENSKNRMEGVLSDRHTMEKVGRIRDKVADKISNPFEGRHYISLDDVAEK